MKVKSLEIVINETLLSLSAATTRQELIDTLGEPDEIEGLSEGAKAGTILVYVDCEFHFSGDAATDNLALIYQEMEHDGQRLTEYAIKLQ